MKKLMAFKSFVVSAALVCGVAADGRAAEWTYADGKITDGTWTIPVTWTAGSEALTINKGATGSGALDLWNLTVDGTPITALSIATEAFTGKSITTFRANHVANDLSRTFNGSAVQSIEIAGDGVTALLYSGNYGFAESCSSLTNATFDCPNLRTIDKWSFLSCGKLATPIEKIVPRTVTSIGEQAFSGCSAMGGDLWLDRTDSIGGKAFGSSGIKSVHLGGGNFTTFTVAKNCGTFEGCGALTNVFIQAAALNICQYTFLSCSSLTHLTFDVKGEIAMPSTARMFESCSAIQELVFTGPAPTQGVMDIMLGYRAASAGEKSVTIYASKLQNGWTDLAAPLTDAEAPLAPEGCFGVYRDGSRKAWLVHRASPYDVTGGSIAIRPSIPDIGTPNVPYGTQNDVEDGTVFSVEPYFIQGTTLYQATGYVIDTYDPDADLWTVTESGSDLSWTYRTYPGIERLTWQFAEAGFTLTFNNSDMSKITLDPAPAFGNGYLADTVVTVSTGDYDEDPTSSFVRWYGDLDATADPDARVQAVTVTKPLRLTAGYRTDNWILTGGVLSNCQWRLNATFNAETGALNVTKCLSGAGLIDWRDIAVNGVPVTSIALATGLFAGSTTLYEFRANGLTDSLTKTFQGSTIEQLDLEGEDVTGLRDSGSYGFAEGCGRLKGVRFDFPNLTTIGVCAFRNCSQLSTPIQEFIPHTVTSIGTQAFSGCSAMGGDLWLDRMDSLGAEAFTAAKINSIHWGVGNFKDFPSAQNGTFERTVGLTNVFIQAAALNICQYTFLGCSSLTHLTFDVPGEIAMPSTARMFESCSAIQELVFTGPAPTQGVMDIMLGYRAASAGEKPVTIYASKKQEGWKALAAPLTDEEKELAPVGCFGVYVTAKNERKAWLVHRTSPYDPTGMTLIFQ